MTLTPAQRRGLSILTGQAAHVAAPGRPLERHQISYAIAEQLVVAGYARPLPRDPAIHPPHGALVITTAGRRALNRPIPEGPPVYLHARDGLTTRGSSKVRGEDEVIDPATLNSYWEEQSLVRRTAAQDRRTAARALVKRLRAS